MVMLTHRIPFCKAPFLAWGGGGVEEREDHTVIETGPLTTPFPPLPARSARFTRFGAENLSAHIYPTVAANDCEKPQ